MFWWAKGLFLRGVKVGVKVVSDEGRYEGSRHTLAPELSWPLLHSDRWSIVPASSSVGKE
jgi:hypothetical protein